MKNFLTSKTLPMITIFFAILVSMYFSLLVFKLDSGTAQVTTQKYLPLILQAEFVSVKAMDDNYLPQQLIQIIKHRIWAKSLSAFYF